MPEPIIVSVTHRSQGLETLSHFLFIEGDIRGGTVCVGCSTHLWDRLTPVELADGGAIDPDSTRDCSPLCRICSYSRAHRIGATWPGGLTVDAISSLWSQVNAELARDLESELAEDKLRTLKGAVQARENVTRRLAQVCGSGGPQ